MFYRLIKPLWAQKLLANQKPNPDFIEEINGPNTYEGVFTPEFVTQQNQLGYNCYFFPNHPSTNVYSEGTKHLKGSHIDVFNYVFVDMDLKDEIYKNKEEFYNKLKSYKVKPTMTVDSGNGVHAYWKVSDLTRETYILIQLGLIKHFKTDHSVWTVLQLLRVPGSLNTKKHKNYKASTLIQDLSSNKEVTIAEFKDELSNLPQDLVNKAQLHIDKLDGKVQINFGHNVDLDELPEEFLILIQNNQYISSLFHDPKGTYGDRSGADMKLANLLYSKDFNKKQVLKIIANTQKAMEKGAHRFAYAAHTVDKVFSTRETKSGINFMSVSERIRKGDKKPSGDPINGPRFLDQGVLTEVWRKKQLCGLIAGPGVGKTTFTLFCFRDMIKNNIDINDDIYVFFSLEMTEKEIINKWIKLVGENSNLTDRLYVIGNENEDGEPRNIGLQEIHEYCTEIKKMTGRNIGALAIDHVGIINRKIDIKKKYTFGAESEQNTGYGQYRTISLNMLCTQLKTLAKMLDTFIIPLTQTTKGKGVGDLPIDKDGAKGISEYEHIMDYIITLWQPLMRVQEQTQHRFLAWQYVKIRNKDGNDKIQTHQHKLLTYNAFTGDLTFPKSEEYEVFTELLPEANELRKNMEKKEVGGYSKTVDFDNIKKMAENVVKNIKVS